jgi:Common central domain of tyrosinase
MTNTNYGSIYTNAKMYDMDNKKVDDKEHLTYPTLFSVTVSGMFALLCVGLVMSVKEYGTMLQNTLGFSATDPISFTLKRQGYPVLDHFKSQTQLSYTFLADYVAIVEPYANMTLYIDNQDMYHTYEYVVCSDADNSCQTGKLGPSLNSVVSFACNPYDTFRVEVDNTYFGSAICMYVRREIASLSSDDLEQTMDAMYTLWSTDEEEGQLIYGSDFHSATYFAEAHHFNAGGRVADHIHEGLGFVTQHIKMSSMFEKSLQSVNPSVSLPYWEFTQESASNTSIYNSIMFTKKTFGSLVEPVDATWGFTYKNDLLSAGTIQNGRWKKAKTDVNTRFSSIVNGYGLLRSPWNMNPSPYITRFASSESALPSCSDYYTLFGSSSTLIDFLDEIQKGSHAPIHSALGGTFGCDVLDAIGSQLLSSSTQLRLCHMWSFYMKDLYRSQFLEPSIGCENDAFDGSPNAISCPYVCNNTTKNDADFVETLKDKMGGQGYFIDGVDWMSIRNFICDGDAHKIVVGAHSDSSSASDPSFWPVHPTQERLLQAYMIATQTTSWDWPEDALTDYVCGTTRCILSGETEKAYDSECCYGHYEYDQMLDYENADENGRIGSTNHEILVATNPVSQEYTMPYVYDGFSWSHCDDVDTAIMRLYRSA